MARRRGRPRKLCFDQSPEFFKVFFPNRSSHQLRIPPAFIKHFNGTIPSKVILKDLSGRVWPVDMEEVESSILIRNGWQSFVRDHSLELGEFLLFKYDGDSLFNVTVYGRNACRKKLTSASEKPAINVKVEEETESDSEDISTTQDQFRKRKYSEIGQRSSEKSREIAEECDRFDATELVSPKAPHFIGSVNQCYPYTLRFPKRWVKDNDIEMKPEMVWLCDQSGKSWLVKMTFSKDGRLCLTKGWLDFWKDNDMGINDQCHFLFAFGKGRRLSREVEVQIIRGSEAAEDTDA